MVDAGAVEHEHGSTGSVLDVMDHYLARSDLHPGRLTGRRGRSPRRPRERDQVLRQTANACAVPVLPPGLSTVICQPCWKSEAMLLETWTAPEMV